MGEAVATAPATATLWRLEAEPTGDVRLLADGALVAAASFAPSPARLVLWGRGANPGASGPAPAGIVSVDTTVSRCDLPGTWRGREPLEVRFENTPVTLPSDVASPSLLSGDVRRLAFATSAGIHLASEGDPGVFQLDAPLDTPLLPDAERGELAILQPELATDDTRELLFYAFEREAGGRAIGLLADGVRQTLITPEAHDLQDISAPTVVLQDGRWVLVARVEDGAGARLAIFRADFPSGSWTLQRSGDLASRTRPQALDADAIGEPSLSVQGASWRLHVSRRRGTRWVTALLASDELLAWREVDLTAFGPRNRLRWNGRPRRRRELGPGHHHAGLRRRRRRPRYPGGDAAPSTDDGAF